MSRSIAVLLDGGHSQKVEESYNDETLTMDALLLQVCIASGSSAGFLCFHRFDHTFLLKSDSLFSKL